MPKKPRKSSRAPMQGKSGHKSDDFTPIGKHRREGSKLLTRLSGLNISMVDWARDLLPEHLWIAALLEQNGTARANILYHATLDALDASSDASPIPTGLISDFALVPPESRDAFQARHRELLDESVVKPLGRYIAYYPECPARWIVPAEDVAGGGPLDPSVDLPRLRALVLKLYDTTSRYVGEVRTMPFSRMARRGSVKFSRQDPYIQELIPLLLKYPRGCTDDEAERVDQFCRIQGNMHYQIAPRYKQAEWPRHFWNQNHAMVVCLLPKRSDLGNSPDEEGAAEALENLAGLLERNAVRAQSYLRQIAVQRKVDLYDPTRDEILLGLLARATRLYLLVCTTVRLWSRDMGSVMLRLLVDTTITFSYLAKFGSDDEFVAFRKYGDGKEKLLRLHLLEHYPTATTLDGQSPRDIGKELGGEFAAELLDVELAGWTKKNARELAEQSGLLEAYRLVYDPASADVHGTWASLRRCNLVRCAEALHRGHRLAVADAPPVSTDMQVFAQRVYEACIDRGIEALSLPPMPEALEVVGEKLVGREDGDVATDSQ